MAAESTLKTLLNTFNANLDEACHLTLECKHNPDPHSLTWWNNECNLTHTAACFATTHEGQHKANHNLHKALHQAKRTWAHKQLHHTIEDCDIWSLAKTHNGQQVHTFLPLKAADSTLVNNLTLKADIFKARFPTAPLPVDDIQPSNPPAHNTRQ